MCSCRYWRTRTKYHHFNHVPLVCLAILFFSNFERGLYVSLDPLGARQIIPRPARRFLHSISVPWIYASTLLLTFFWSEAISVTHTTPLHFLSRYKRHFQISAVGLVLLDLAFSILDVVYVSDLFMVPVVEIVFASVGFFIACMYFQVASRVLQRFKLERSKNVDAKHIDMEEASNGADHMDVEITVEMKVERERQKTIRESRDKVVRMSQLLILSGAGLVLFVIGTAITPWANEELDSPVTAISRSFLSFFALWAVGACQVCAF